MEMTDRKKQILKIVVEEYVAAAEPVGSKAIAQRMPGKISSATIRNELADLTEMGYLEQPHTSAGPVSYTHLSSGVTARMGVPMGVCTRAMASSGMPASRSRWFTDAVLRREPMTPT